MAVVRFTKSNIDKHVFIRKLSTTASIPNIYYCYVRGLTISSTDGNLLRYPVSANTAAILIMMKAAPAVKKHQPYR